jgi:uroporphyrin-III C-methyltransferase
MNNNVIIAGAGPGDPELITVKLSKALQQADVIITDRLVNPAIITQWAKRDVLVLWAGKQGYSNASASQLQINNWMVEYAVQQKKVLRLKGGDVAFFSNVLDELQVLVTNNISFEIIPGITAASGASAYAGIPLTARGYAQSVQFITFNPKSYYSPDTWKQLSQAEGTLVLYMSAKNIATVADLLLRYFRKPNTPLAVIEQATTIYQKVHTSTLAQCADHFYNYSFSSPSLVIIGEVVHLHPLFKWFENIGSGTVFKDLV